mgnify:FL=1
MSNLFDAQTKDVIESRMTQTLHTITEKEQSTMEGTFARDLIDANAVEFESSYAEMAMLRDAAFAKTSWGDYLTLRAAEFGVDRKKAVKAKGEVTVTGMAGATSFAAVSSRQKTADAFTPWSRPPFLPMPLRLRFLWKPPMPERLAMWPKERLQKSPIPSRISRSR